MGALLLDGPCLGEAHTLHFSPFHLLGRDCIAFTAELKAFIIATLQ